MRLLRRSSVDDARLWVPEPVFERIVAEADEWAPLETGGALMGYESRDGLVIMDLVGAGPNAVRRRSEFVPDPEYQLADMARVYEASGRVHTYIGDWHTHPGSLPAPSLKDRRAVWMVSRNAASRCERPLMLIMGGGNPWIPVAWRYDARRWIPQLDTMQVHRVPGTSNV